MGVSACEQLLNVGWRFGMQLDEAQALFDEGLAFANSAGDRRAALNLSQVYARQHGAAGDVARYLETALANRIAAEQIDDVAVQANSWGYAIDASCFATRLPEALAMAEEALSRFPRHIPRQDWIVGVSPYSWYSLWRGYCLGWTGRLSQSIEEYGRCLRLAEEDELPEMSGYALSFTAEPSLSAARCGSLARMRPTL